MKFIAIIERLQRIDRLIRTEATGCPKKFAEKLEVSESTLYETLNCLKDLGADIYFNRQKNSYSYKIPVKLIFKLDKEDMEEIKGGSLLIQDTLKKSEY